MGKLVQNYFFFFSKQVFEFQTWITARFINFSKFFNNTNQYKNLGSEKSKNIQKNEKIHKKKRAQIDILLKETKPKNKFARVGCSPLRSKKKN